MCNARDHDHSGRTHVPVAWCSSNMRFRISDSAPASGHRLPSALIAHTATFVARNRSGRHQRFLLRINVCLHPNSNALSILRYADIDEACEKPWKWGGAQARLEEQRRIFRSVRKEHLELTEKLAESTRELEAIKKEIPRKSRLRIAALCKADDI
jgi:hypothetical protein